MKNRNRLIISLFALAFLALIGGVFAVSNDKSILQNVFGTATYRTVNTEVFTSPTNWQTCEEIPKTVTVKNESTVPVVARVKYTEQWIASDRTSELDLVDSATGLRMAVVNRDNVDKWVLNEDDGFYYYYLPLEPGETTASFLKSVTLNCNANMSGSAINTCTEINGNIVCESSANPYAEATYTLRTTISSIQNNVAKDEWDYEPTVSEATLLKGAFVTGRIGSAENIVRVSELPENFPTTDSWRSINNGGVRASTESSEKPVYMWDAGQYESWGGEIIEGKYQEGTIYWYSEAAQIYYNPDMSGFMAQGNGAALTDMSFYGSFDASRVLDLSGAFSGLAISDLSFLAGWNVSSVENLSGAFANDTALADVSALSGWNVAKVADFSSLFLDDSALTSVTALKNWDMSSATTIEAMFSGCTGVTDGDELETWSNTLDTANVVMTNAFDGTLTQPSWYITN